VKDNELYDKSLNQHLTEIILRITALATFALIVVAKEPTAKTYTIREETHNNERKSD